MIAENEVDSSCRELGVLFLKDYASDMFHKLDVRPRKKNRFIYGFYTDLCQQQDDCKPL